MTLSINQSDKLKDHFDCITNDWIELLELWKRIGFKNEKLDDRNNAFFKAISDTINDIKDGDYELEERIEESIKKHKQRVNDLKHRLNLDPNKLNFKTKIDADTKLTLIEEDKYYRDLLRAIEKVKFERKEKFQELKRKEHELCKLLNENSYTINDGKLVNKVVKAFLNFYYFDKYRQLLKASWKI